MPYKDCRRNEWIGQVKQTQPDGTVKKHCKRFKLRRDAMAWEREVKDGPRPREPAKSDQGQTPTAGPNGQRESATPQNRYLKS